MTKMVLPEDFRSSISISRLAEGNTLDERAADLHNQALAISSAMEKLSDEYEAAGRPWPGKLLLAAATYTGCACDQVVIAIEGVPKAGAEGA